METKPLLYGIVGFILGGLIVSIAAVTIEKPKDDSMAHMVSSLQSKRGDDFDKAFVNGMIEHHQGAIDMANLAAKQAKHTEVKELSRNIIKTQESEIQRMQQWRNDWGYAPDSHMH